MRGVHKADWQDGFSEFGEKPRKCSTLEANWGKCIKEEGTSNYVKCP